MTPKTTDVLPKAKYVKLFSFDESLPETEISVPDVFALSVLSASVREEDNIRLIGIIELIKGIKIPMKIA